MTAAATKNDAHLQVLDFCPGCFADSRGGSWGPGVEGPWCGNCGSHGTVQMPIWAVDAIRKNASWVGKRYYPHQEDKELSRELRYLRSCMPAPIGRTVTRADYDGCNPNDWRVVQKYPDGSEVSTTVRAENAGPALRIGERVLAYPVPDTFEKPQPNPSTNVPMEYGPRVEGDG